MIHVGIDLHHKNSYVRAMDDDGVLFPGRRVYHTDIDQLWQYLGQFNNEEIRSVGQNPTSKIFLSRYRLLLIK